MLGSDSLAHQARVALRRHVLEPLAAHVPDEEYGGFLVDLDERWQSAGRHEKSLEHAARTTISFALLNRAFPGEGCDRLALSGARYLLDVMWDEEYGGFYARVDRAGTPLWGGLKHPHAATYAVTALSLCEDILPPGESHRSVSRSLEWLNTVAWDTKHGGYWGSYRRDNDPYPEGEPLPTTDGLDPIGLPNGLKEINTQSDAVAMLIGLGPNRDASRSAERLDALLSLVVDRLVDAGGAMPLAYQRDWTRKHSLVRIGHVFQTSRRMLPLVGADDARGLLSTCRRLVDFGLANARHRSGGFVFAVGADVQWPSTAPANNQRQWWVQIEAVYALDGLARHSLVSPELRTAYGAERDRQWSGIVRDYFDDQYGGLREVPWPSKGRIRVPLRRRPAAPLKSHAWKDASHEVELLYMLASSATPERGSS